jgi:hypothetical protein
MSDELRSLWTEQRVKEVEDMTRLIRVFEKRLKHFDSKVKRRNMIEIAAGLLVLVGFGAGAVIAPDWRMRTACLINCAAIIWVMGFILWKGTGPQELAPDATLESYRESLRRRYDYQIQLLRNVKFWYLLPLYIGIVSVNVVSNPGKYGFLAVATALFAVIWWLNEGYGVRKLKKEKAALELQNGVEG